MNIKEIIRAVKPKTDESYYDYSCRIESLDLDFTKEFEIAIKQVSYADLFEIKCSLFDWINDLDLTNDVDTLWERHLDEAYCLVKERWDYQKRLVSSTSETTEPCLNC